MLEKLIIVRHARSRTNIRATDEANPPLTDFGVAQAVRVGRFLHHHVGVKDAIFYASPFLRCLETARLIRAQGPDFQSIFIDSRLREYLNHSCREATIPIRGDGHQRGDSFVWLRDLSETSCEDNSVTYHDEFNEQLLWRVRDFYDECDRREYLRNRPCVVVTHGLPALTLLKVATDPNCNSVPLWDHSLDNASITLVSRGRVVWRGRNLYHELDYDPFERRRPYDESDFLVTE